MVKFFSSIVFLVICCFILGCTSSSFEINESEPFDLLLSKDWTLNKIDQNELNEISLSTWRWNEDNTLLIEFDDRFITANWYRVLKNNKIFITIEFAEMEIPQRIRINHLRTEFELIKVDNCLKLLSQNNVELTFC
jgi:hypothetical protein